MKQSELDHYQYSGEHPWRDHEVMRELYVERGLTQTEIGELLGCTQTNVSRWLSRHDIALESTPGPWDNKDLLHEAYIDKKKSAKEIADGWGCSRSHIRSKLEEYGIPRRSLPESQLAKYLRDPDIPIRTDRDGYERIEHHYNGDRTRVAVHRLLAVAEFGFDVLRDKHVHHGKEGDALPACNIPWANWPGNIELVEREKHEQRHHELRMQNPAAPHQDREVLWELYWEQDMTQYEMADELDCHRASIKTWMKHHKIRPSDID